MALDHGLNWGIDALDDNCGPNGLLLAAVGAHARHAGRFNVTLNQEFARQAGGVLRRSGRGLFEHAYVRRDGIWTSERSSYRPM